MRWLLPGLVGLVVGCSAAALRSGPAGSPDAALPVDAAFADLATPDLDPPQPTWRAAWHHSLGTVRTVNVTTYRIRMRSALRGGAVRLGFFGGVGNGWNLGRAYVGHALPGGTVGADNQPLQFQGQPGANVGNNQMVFSDELAMPVQAGDELYVTFTASFVISRGWTESIQALSVLGDVADSATLPGASDAGDDFGVQQLDVSTSSTAPATVCLGDSITEGVGPTSPDTSWPTQATAQSARPWLNSGIAGDDTTLVTDRIPRDVLDLPGVQRVVVLLGTNDIARGVSADMLLANLGQIYAQAQARGIRPVPATLTPRSDAFWLARPGLESIRQQVNAALRAMAGAIDFDAALSDPAQPGLLPTQYDSGDGVHPSPAGYSVMARTAAVK